MAVELQPDALVALNRLTLVARVVPGTAHDINNALQIINGSADLLARAAEITDAARRAIDRVQAQSTRAASAVQALMQFTRDAGDAPARVSLKDVVSEVLGMRAYAFRRGRLTLAFDPAAGPPTFVRASRSHLQQIVFNLTLNAEQALAGAEGGRVTVELSEAQGHALLWIVDNGRGIDPAVADRLFEPFVSASAVAGAPGLGLPASRILARQMGGDVSLESSAVGALATLRLPIVD